MDPRPEISQRTIIEALLAHHNQPPLPRFSTHEGPEAPRSMATVPASLGSFLDAAESASNDGTRCNPNHKLRLLIYASGPHTFLGFKLRLEEACGILHLLADYRVLIWNIDFSPVVGSDPGDGDFFDLLRLLVQYRRRPPGGQSSVAAFSHLNQPLVANGLPRQRWQLINKVHANIAYGVDHERDISMLLASLVEAEVYGYLLADCPSHEEPHRVASISVNNSEPEPRLDPTSVATRQQSAHQEGTISLAPMGNNDSIMRFVVPSGGTHPTKIAPPTLTQELLSTQVIHMAQDATHDLTSQAAVFHSNAGPSDQAVQNLIRLFASHLPDPLKQAFISKWVEEVRKELCVSILREVGHDVITAARDVQDWAYTLKRLTGPTGILCSVARRNAKPGTLGGLISITCKKCTKVMRTHNALENYTRHLLEHYGIRFKCRVGCDATISWYTERNRHERNMSIHP